MSTYLVEEKVDAAVKDLLSLPLFLFPFLLPPPLCKTQREAPKWDKGGSLHPLCYEIKIRKGRGGGGGEAKKDEPTGKGKPARKEKEGRRRGGSFLASAYSVS